MHIILVSDRMATARTVSFGAKQMIFGLVSLGMLVITLSLMISYWSVKRAADLDLPFLQSIIRNINAEDNARSEAFLRENLSTMAIRLGEMQAQMTRLDAIGERLAAASGIKPQDLKAISASADGRGGPLISPQPMTMQDLDELMQSVSRQLEQRSDSMAVIESMLLEQRIRRAMLPTSMPVHAQWNASTYGWRVDPFTGDRAMHEGVDFPAPAGTAIFAAAAGVVINVERHAQYGNLIEIRHGNEISTRYAHASVVLVKTGAVVKRGQKIAEVGTTGRSTGPHLHFEVRVRGEAQNPNRFLEEASKLAKLNPGADDALLNVGALPAAKPIVQAAVAPVAQPAIHPAVPPSNNPVVVSVERNPAVSAGTTAQQPAVQVDHTGLK